MAILETRIRRKRRIAALLILAGGLYAFICYFLAEGFVRPPRNRNIGDDRVATLMAPSSHGAVPCWTNKGFGNSELIFILAHGYGGSRRDWVELIPKLAAKGYDAIAPSMPGQDMSPERTVGFGPREAEFIREVAVWCRGRAGRPIKVVYVGISLGGSAAWLASELEPRPDAVVSEGSFAELDPVMKRWFDREFPFANVLLRPTIWFASWKAGIQPGEIRPVHAASLWRGRPGLVIVGTADKVIDPAQSVALANAAAVPLWTVARGEHAKVQRVAMDEYVSRLDRLARQLLNRK